MVSLLYNLDMEQTHEHHDHGHGHLNADGPLKWTLAIVLVVMIAEFVGGFLSNSLALIGDAGHMLTDALAIVLSIVAIAVARLARFSTAPNRSLSLSIFSF